MKKNLVSEIQAGLAQSDHVISQLLSRVDAMELKQTNPPTSAVAKVSSSKKKAAKVQVTVTPPAKSKPAGRKSLPSLESKKTPIKQRACLVTLPSAKKSPLQMTKKDHLKGFEHTKVSQLAQYPT
jgi:hypothetical protein